MTSGVFVSCGYECIVIKFIRCSEGLFGVIKFQLKVGINDLSSA